MVCRLTRAVTRRPLCTPLPVAYLRGRNQQAPHSRRGPRSSAGEKQGPGTFKIAGGWTVKVSKVGELRYRAQFISPSGDADDTVEANQHDIGFVTNGVYVVLSAGGVISAHA